MLYLFVSAYENGKSLVKSAAVGIEEFGNFEDLLKAALDQKELFFEEMLVKVDFQCNDSLVWHSILELLTSRVESSHESKTLNFKVLFIKLEYN